MLDFSVTFNIIFAVVAGALGLFMLASFIAVAAVGKRRCNAFDVILRIVASLAFAAAVALVAAVVLTRLDGAYKIVAAQASATLVFGASSFELPLPELFVALDTIMGACLAGAVFAFSLIALICDCVLANKKKKRELKVTNSVKTPEQRRIAAEVAKIRAIGNSAVRRTAAAAENAESTEQSEPTEQADASVSARQPDGGDDIIHSEKTDEAADTARADGQAQAEPAPDWRATETTHSDFVGLSGNADPDFDTFDSFDEFVGAGDGAADNADADARANAADGVIADYGHSADAFEELDTDEIPEALDEDAYESADGELDTDEQFAASDDAAENADYADAFDTAENAEAQAERDEYDERSEYAAPDGEADEQYGYDGDYSGEAEEYDSDEIDEYGAVSDDARDADYAPNRNIYFPRVRTISRYADEPAQAARKPAAAKPSASGAKAAAQKPAVKGGKKPAAQKSAQTPRKNQGAGAGAAKRTASPSGDDSRKLPVNRRYVIIDRRSAVNMFGDYLRERDGESKDKLKSSISTIILK